jgi:hypothetical protein
MGSLRDAGQNAAQSQVVAGRNRPSAVSPRALSVFRSERVLLSTQHNDGNAAQ